LGGIWGSGPSDIYAVGDDGAIIRYNGSTWSLMNSNTTRWIFDIWGTSHTNVWAGYEYGVLHYNGKTWTTIPLGGNYSKNGLWGTSHSNVYAVGKKGIIHQYKPIP